MRTEFCAALKRQFNYVVVGICVAGAHAAARTRMVRGVRSYPTTVKAYENDTVLLPCYVEDQGMWLTILCVYGLCVCCSFPSFDGND